MKIEDKILNLENVFTTVKKLRETDKKICFCSGCYDILQSGHAVFFSQCKEFADILIVGVGRDNVIQKIKGESRPINPEQNRIYLVASMEEVDYVVLNGEEILPGKIDFYEVINKIRPDYLILNDDDSAIKEKKELCDGLGIEIRLVKRTVPDYLERTSTSEIIAKLDNLKK